MKKAATRPKKRESRSKESPAKPEVTLAAGGKTETHAGHSFDKAFALWRSVLVEPRAVFAQQVAKADLGKAVLWFALGGAISTLLSTLFSFKIILAVPIAIAAAVAVPVLMLLASLVVFLFARIFGGKGSFSQQTYLISLYQPPLGILRAAAGVAFGLVPFLGNGLSAFFVFATAVYELYLLTLALKAVHGFGKFRAILSWAIPLAIFAILVALAILFLIVAVIGSLGSLVGVYQLSNVFS